MINVPVYNMNGDEVSKISIDENELGGSINPALIKQAFVCYHANLRQGSSRTKNRHDVEGTTKKMYKQKGTGRARHRNKLAPQFKGGGRAFAKRRVREDYHLDMPKKMRRKANRNALLAKLLDNEVRVIDSISMTEPKTKAFNDFLKAINVDRTALVALPEGDTSRVARLSARNIPSVSLCRCDQLTAFNLLNNRYLVIGQEDLKAWLSGPSSQIGKDAKLNPMGRVAAEAK